MGQSELGAAASCKAVRWDYALVCLLANLRICTKFSKKVGNGSMNK